jgi:VanZ family protein
MAVDSWVRPELRLGSRWLLLGGLMLIAVILVSVIPIKSEPAADFTYLDKFAHFFVYVGLMVFFNGFLQPRLRPQLAIFLMCSGILIEMVQMPVPGRAAELADFGADVLGIMVGWLLVRLEYFNWCHWLDARLARNG